MGPFVVASLLALRRRDRAAGITLQPIPNHVVIELLGPEHSSKALAHHVLCVRREILRNDGAIELVCFKSAEREGLVEAVERVLSLKVGVRKTHSDYGSPSRLNGELVMRRCFGTRMLWIDCVFCAMYHVVVDAVLEVGRAIFRSKQPSCVGLVLGEQQFRRAFAMQPAIARLSLI